MNDTFNSIDLDEPTPRGDGRRTAMVLLIACLAGLLALAVLRGQDITGIVFLGATVFLTTRLGRGSVLWDVAFVACVILWAWWSGVAFGPFQLVLKTIGIAILIGGRLVMRAKEDHLIVPSPAGRGRPRSGG